MVLFIIMLLLAVMMPSIQSAFVEQAVRGDAHQLSLMVKTAMLQSSEQHRPYVIELTDTTMALQPLGGPLKDASSSSDEEPIISQLDSPNKLLAPDPKKADAWIAMTATTWLFKPGELCPAPRVRLARGQAWVEMSFNALTGNVENEAAYFP